MKRYLIAAVGCIALVSCHGMLDTEPKNQVAQGVMWTSENLTDQGVMGVYANLRNWGIYTGGISASSQYIGSSTNPSNANGLGQWSFETLSPLGQSHGTGSFLSGSLSPGDGSVLNTWKKLYEGVHRANDAIFNIPLKSPVSDEKKGRLVAEVKFLRAFFYYRLNELWRGVPYYDVPVSIDECVKGQETEEFIWGKILDDLNACIAEPNLPNNDFASARVTKGAAYALRGKVYMQKGMWAEAIKDFESVEACGYGLFAGDYKALFTAAQERSKEMIFSVENISLQYYGSICQKYLGTRSASGSNWGDHNIHPFAVDLYENADGTPFDWDDVIAGYDALTPAAREVYFLRDTLDANGATRQLNIGNAVRTRLAATALAAVKNNYLPYGNEARIKAAYENRDPRLTKNVITPYSEFLGVNNVVATENFTYTMRWPYVMNATPLAVTGSTTGEKFVFGDFQPDYIANYIYFQRKFVTEGYPGATFNREWVEIDDPMIRYADVLLMKAEAQVELDKLSDAEASVKLVRDRVGMPTLSSNFASKELARNYVRDERRREMLGEGGAYFDELRWGTYKQTKFAAGNSQQVVWGAVGRGSMWQWPSLYSGDEYVWPIPRSEIEKNRNLTATPGWTY